MRLGPAGLRGQLVLWLMGPIICLTITMGLFSYVQATSAVAAAYDNSLHGSALAIAERIGMIDGELGVDLPHVALEMLDSDSQDRVYYKVTDSSGTAITGYPDLPNPPATASIDVVQFFDSAYRGERIRQVALRRRIFGSPGAGIVIVQVGETLIKRSVLEGRILTITVVFLAVLVMFAPLVVWFVVGHGLRSLRQLELALAGRDPRALQPVGFLSGPREVRLLAEAINHLIVRLRRSMVGMERFIADASHQLRTPLAAVQTHVELLLRGTIPAASRDSLTQILRSVRSATHLTNQLLLLAQADPGANDVSRFEPVDLVDFTSDLVAEWVPRALDKNVDLGLDSDPPPLVVTANPLLLREMFGNLLDNAIRYVGPHGIVTMRVTVSKGATFVTVEDDGIGIPASDHARVLERFYRVPGTAGEGSGLGLAIVNDIARLHGASLHLATGRSGRGLAATVIFPP